MLKGRDEPTDPWSAGKALVLGLRAPGQPGPGPTVRRPGEGRAGLLQPGRPARAAGSAGKRTARCRLRAWRDQLGTQRQITKQVAPG